MKNGLKKSIAILLCVAALSAFYACSSLLNTLAGEASETNRSSTGNISESNPTAETGGYDYSTRLNDNDPTIKLSVDEFKTKARKLGFKTPAFNEMIQFGALDTATAQKNYHGTMLWQAEYYVFADEEIAKTSFDGIAGDADAETETKPDGTVILEKTEDGQYTYAAFYGRSLLFITADEQYTTQVKEFVKAVGF